MTGTQIGMYRLVRQQGTGALGEVWFAEHVKTGRPAAVKILAGQLTAIPGGIDRLFLELRATSLVRHPGMVEIHDCDRLPDGRGYIIREFLEGETLRDCLVRTGSFGNDLDAVRVIMIQLADALESAHEKGIAHLDLKPENIFLATAADQDPPIQVKLLDFGMANLAQRGTKRTAMATGLTVGTAQYLSPEQCRGTGDPDHRADVYALGCVLFELLTGRPPFVKKGAGELLAAHMMEPAPRVSDLNPGLGVGFDRILQSMLAKNPADRPSSLGEIASAVAAATHEQPVRAGMTVMLDAAPTAAAPKKTVFLTPADLSHLPSVASSLPGPSPEPVAAAAPVISPTPEPARPGLAGGTRILLPGEAQNVLPRISATNRSAPSDEPRRRASAGEPVRRQQATTLSSTLGELELRPAGGSWKRPALVAVGGIVLVGVATFLLVKSPDQTSPAAAVAPRPEPAAPPPPSVPAPPVAAAQEAPAPRPQSVTVKVDSSPLGARVSVVGEETPLGETPLKVSRPRGGILRIRLEKPGYQPQEQELELDNDVVVTLQLKKRRDSSAGLNDHVLVPAFMKADRKKHPEKM